MQTILIVMRISEFCNENFNKRYPARSVTSYIVCTNEMVISQKLLEKTYFIVKMADLAMNRL